MSEAQLRSSVKGDVTTARWALILVLIDRAGWTYPRLAKLLNKDRTGILYGYRKACQLYRTDPTFYATVGRIEQELDL